MDDLRTPDVDYKWPSNRILLFLDGPGEKHRGVSSGFRGFLLDCSGTAPHAHTRQSMTHNCDFLAQRSLDLRNREIDPDPEPLCLLGIPGPWSQNRLPVAGGPRHVTGSDMASCGSSELAGKLQHPDWSAW